MELKEREKLLVLEILLKADGEDIEEIIERSIWKEWLTRSLVLGANSKHLRLYIEERYGVRKQQKLIPHDV